MRIENVGSKLYEAGKIGLIGTGLLVIGSALIAVAPLVGAVGIVATTAKTVYDIARYQLARFQNYKNPTPLATRNVDYYHSRLKENVLHFDLFARLLIPVIGIALACMNKRIVASIIGSVADLAATVSLVRKGIFASFFPFAGGTHQTLFERHSETSIEGLKQAEKAKNRSMISLYQEELNKRVNYLSEYCDQHLNTKEKMTLKTMLEALKIQGTAAAYKQVFSYIRSFLSKHPELVKKCYDNWYQQQVRIPLLNTYGGENICLKTKDQRQVDAAWFPQADASSAATVVVFHGNACLLDAMEKFIQYFKEQGCNVLAVTMGGYPGSAEGTSLSELSIYRDVQAAGDYLKQQGINHHKTVAYGLSMGGALAVQYGVLHPGSHVIADQTFTSALSVTKNIFEKISLISTPLNEAPLERLIEHTLLPVGKTDGTFTTDGLNTLAKVENLRGKFLAIESREDFLMSHPNPKQNLAYRLAEKYTITHSEPAHLLQIPGGHGSCFSNYKEAADLVKTFIPLASPQTT